MATSTNEMHNFLLEFSPYHTYIGIDKRIRTKTFTISALISETLKQIHTLARGKILSNIMMR